MHSGRLNKPSSLQLQHIVRESNERTENAKLVNLPGAVNFAGGADLSKVQPALHFLVKRNFNISK